MSQLTPSSAPRIIYDTWHVFGAVTRIFYYTVDIKCYKERLDIR